MDVITSVKDCLRRWNNEGQAECRDIVTSPHCNPADQECVDTLTSAYQTLIQSTLLTWSPQTALSTASFVTFVQQVLSRLPSTSTNSSRKPPNIFIFGELLVDLIWAVDSELDEILADAKLIINANDQEVHTGLERQDEQEPRRKERIQNAQKAATAKYNVETDKETLADIVKKLLISNVLEPQLCRERLDMSLLTSVGLLHDKGAFEKKEIRTRTGLFYKQNKFNLLREQSEGYTKLTTDLVSSFGPPHAAANGLPTESPALIERRARSAWERVISLIGYFDLDPNRALDVILDVFSVNLATHHQFFLSLLSFSPWAGESRRLVDNTRMAVEPNPDQYRGKSVDEVLLIAEAQSGLGSELLSPRVKLKPQVLAQVLGFKFTYYQSTDALESCPKSLYLTAALLIREGLMTLEDIYPHLGPPDDDMSKYHEKYLQSVKARISASRMNLLAMAAPLRDPGDSGPSTQSLPATTKAKATSSLTPEKKIDLEEKESPNQKASILVALLSVGAIRPAISLLSKFPWLVDYQPEIADLILRVLKTSIEPLYESVMPKKPPGGSFLQPRSRYSTGGVVPPPSRKPQLTLWAPTPPSTHIHDFVFFYPQWSNRVPICRSMGDLVDVIEPLMGFIGLHVARSPMFLTKFLRIGKVHLMATIPTEPPDTKRQTEIAEPDHPTQRFWLKVSRKYLLPALSMTPGNAVCTVDVWSILKQFDTTLRWNLYGEWRDVTYKSHPELKVQHILREREAKSLLRRLSSLTMEGLAGAVAKLVHSNPCIIFTNAVNQIQSYENLADVVIQALRYATTMGFDILVFIILDALANPHKDRVKDDGVNASDWLQNLATFTGSMFRRYGSDLTPLLKYIVHQLYNGQTSEIIVLEKLMLKMAGIEPLPSLSDAQITSMAGGPTLRIETIASTLRGASFDVTDVHLRGTTRLGAALVETKLAFPLLIQVAQQRQACVFRTQSAHIKSIASLFDATHGVLFQYLDLLSTSGAVSPTDYKAMMPSLAEICSLYGITPPIGMQIIRPLLREAVATQALAWKSKKQAEKTESAVAAEKRLKAALAAKRDPGNFATTVVEGMVADGVSASADKMDVVASSETSENRENSPRPISPWIPEISALFDDCKKLAPGNTYDVIGPSFYMTFWQMSSYDLYFPKEKYEEVEKQLNASSDAFHTKYRQADASSNRSIRQLALGYRSQRERFINTAKELREEKETQDAVVHFTTDEGGRLDQEKNHWFSHAVGLGKVTSFVSSLIEHCIQPRCLLSPMDADFCARIIKALHVRGTPGFPTLVCYDKLLGEHIRVVIFSCTEREARNYGRFLRGILQDLYHWHKDERAFNDCNRLRVGGKISLLPGFQKRWSNEGPATIDDLLKWSDFKSFLKKCHRKLGRCFSDCIESGVFMHVYNAVLVLKEIIDVFPIAAVNEVVGSSVDLVVSRLAETEERGDLKILARAYSSSLKKREPLWAMPSTGQSIKATPSTAPSKATTPTPTVASELTAGTTASSSQAPDKAKTSHPPSGPRASQTNTQTAPIMTEKSGVAPERAVTTKLALESIPRPEVVKRVRPDIKSSASPQPEAGQRDPHPQVDATQVDRASPAERPKHPLPTGPAARLPPTLQSQLNRSPLRSEPRGENIPSPSPLGHRKDFQSQTNGHSRPATPSQQVTRGAGGDGTQSPHHRPTEDVHRQDPSQAMPPPSAPSQAYSAQEFRSSAKQSNTPRELGRLAQDSRASGPTTTPVLTAKRSTSPPTHPGTRDHSADSRTSIPGQRSRSDRDGEGDGLEDKRAHRDPQGRSERGERGGSGAGHRDAFHARSERNGRDRIPGGRDGDREKDSGRDRDRARDREKEREARDREGGRDRDRDRERDRHRREEKDRERDHRKDRDVHPSTSTGRDAGPAPDHAVPARPDPSRTRPLTYPSNDDTLGKRRRAPDDESDRGSKRGSRHREDRSRRSSDKDKEKEKDREERPRDSDRRRKDRDGAEGDGKSQPDKLSDRALRAADTSGKTVPPPPPSGPRAMASNVNLSPRHGRSEPTPSSRERGGPRDSGPHGSGNGTHNSGSHNRANHHANAPSLQSRIGEKDPLPGNPAAQPRGGQFDPRRNEGASQHVNEDGAHDAKKRTLSDRERDLKDGAGHAESAVQPPKRLRINRNRYTESSAGSARRVQPIDHHAGETGDRTAGKE